MKIKKKKKEFLELKIKLNLENIESIQRSRAEYMHGAITIIKNDSNTFLKVYDNTWNDLIHAIKDAADEVKIEQ